MSAHDRLAKAGITPTTDAEKAYRLGLEDGRSFEGSLNDELLRRESHLQDELDVLRARMTEIGLLASRRAK